METHGFDLLVEKSKEVEKHKEQTANNYDGVDALLFKLKQRVIELFLISARESDAGAKKRLLDDANELVVEYIEENKRIITIRADIKDPEMFIYDSGIYIPEARTYIKNICRYIMGKAYTTNFSNKIICKIEADTYMNQVDFYEVKDEYIIPVKNGLLNLKTKELSEFTPDFIFTNKLSVTYDPEKKCERIINFFNEVLKHPETDVKVMQQWIGYCLVKNYNFQYATMFLGNGRNGKGVALSLIRALIGGENISSLTLQKIETDRFCLSDLYNKYANIAGDLSKTALKETGYFLQLTGQDQITVDRKYKSLINFVNYAKMMFATNNLPYSYDDSDGFYDRWIIFDFPYKFVEEIKDASFEKLRDEELKDKLTSENEMSGFLNWSIEGLNILLENKSFSNNKTTDDNRTKWKRQSSSFNAFFEDHCEINFQEYTIIEDLKQYYQKYCSKHKLKFESNVIIKKILEQNGCDQTVKKIEFADFSQAKRVWIGLFVTNIGNL